jgi:transposase InsO family protein
VAGLLHGSARTTPRIRAELQRLTRSSLHRCLQRHGISRRPSAELPARGRGRFADTPLGFVHIDVSELRVAAHKIQMFLAIDRVSQFTFVEFHPRTTMLTGAAFLRSAIQAFPCRIHTVLTDNGRPFADLPHHRAGATAEFRGHAFDRVCWLHGIDHRLTKPHHPWTNGQAERMNRTVKDATVKTFHYDTVAALLDHIRAFVMARNFAKHLRALRWRTPFEALCEAWTLDPERFTINPHHLIPGPNI